MNTSVLAPLESTTTERSFRALGTTAIVVTTVAAHADEAERILRAEVEAVDLACSRFRLDSELAAFHAHAGRVVRVSPPLFEALAVAYAVAERTHGAVDPTVGSAMATLGYDRDFEEIQSRPLRLADLGPVPGFRHLHLDHERRTARIPGTFALILDRRPRPFLPIGQPHKSPRSSVRECSSASGVTLRSPASHRRKVGPSELPSTPRRVLTRWTRSSRSGAAGSPVQVRRSEPGKWELTRCITSSTRQRAAARLRSGGSYPRSGRVRRRQRTVDRRRGLGRPGDRATPPFRPGGPPGPP